MQTLCRSVAAKLVASLLNVLLHVPVKQHGKTMHHVMCNAHDLQRSQCAEAAKRKIICDNGVYARYQTSSGRCSLMKLQIMLSYTKQRRRRSSYSASFNISVLVVLSTSLKYDRHKAQIVMNMAFSHACSTKCTYNLCSARHLLVQPYNGQDAFQRQYCSSVLCLCILVSLLTC